MGGLWYWASFNQCCAASFHKESQTKLSYYHLNIYLKRLAFTLGKAEATTQPAENFHVSICVFPVPVEKHLQEPLNSIASLKRVNIYPTSMIWV